MSVDILYFDNLRDVLDNLNEFLYFIHLHDVDYFLLHELCKFRINFRLQFWKSQEQLFELSGEKMD